MSSRIVKCDGFVLRNLRYGDTSRVATVFTRELGKISVIGKGVRVPKSPFGASLELFCRSDYVVYYRVGRNIQMLKSGDVNLEYVGLLRSARRYVFGCAVLEFLDRMLLEDEPIDGLFSLTCRALLHLEEMPGSRLSEVFRAYQLRTAAMLGYSPMLDECLHCGHSLLEAISTAPDPAREIWSFLIAEGGAVCPRCRGGSEGAVRLTARALWRMRSMAQGNRRRPEENGSGTDREPQASAPNDAWVRTLEFIVEEFLQYHVERYRGLRSLRSSIGFADPAATSRA